MANNDKKVKYNKQVARELYAELQEHLESTPGRIDQATDEGPVIDLICQALGAAISALKKEPHA